MSNFKTKHFVLLALYVAIEIIIATTPLGSVPIGPVVATIAHLPVLIAAFTLPKNGGLIMGFVFGLLSFLVWTFMPPSPIAFLFTPFHSLANMPNSYLSLVVCFAPRMIFGFVADIIVAKAKSYPVLVVTSLVTSAIHSLLFVLFAYLFFNEAISAIFGTTGLIAFLTLIIVPNGLAEIALAGFVIPPLALAINRIIKK